jgi:hypothetical protein
MASVVLMHNRTLQAIPVVPTPALPHGPVCQWEREVDAVVEIPAISVDTRTEGGVHFVERWAVAEGPDEVPNT